MNLKNFDLTFIHLNDIHGRVNGENNSISFSKLFTFLETLRSDKRNGRVFVIDSGDTLHGTSFANLSKGESIVELFNSLKFDYATLGNHDFNFGYEQLKKLLNEQNYKTLALNFVDNEKLNDKILPFDIIEINDFKICFFGLITPETYYKTNSKNIKNLDFKNPIDSVKELLNELKSEHIDFYVGITHLGCDKTTEEDYQSIHLAKCFPEINLILDGHSHTTIDKKLIINNALISQTGNYNNKISLIKVKIDKINKEHLLEYKLLNKNDIDLYEADIDIQNKIDRITKSQENMLNSVIAKTKFPLIGDRDLVRKGETNFTQLITDAILWKTKCDAVLINGGSIRDSIEAGDIKVGDIKNSIPFGNYIVIKKIQGSDLKLALENGLKGFPQNLGAMAQVAGLKVFFDSNKPPLNRIQNIVINDTPLNLNNYYHIATTDFMALGGEEYTSFIHGEEVFSYPAVEDIVIEYIKKFGVNSTFNIVPRLITN